MHAMKLLHIQATDDMSESLDWFVVAKDADEAITLWRDICDQNGLTPDGDPTRIRIILPDVSGTPFSGCARAVEWTDLTVIWEGN